MAFSQGEQFGQINMEIQGEILTKKNKLLLVIKKSQILIFLYLI